MKTIYLWPLKCAPAGLLCLFSGSANAARLIVEPESSILLHIGAAALLYLHIGGGAIGLLSGLTASLSRKGGYLHRIAGKVFFIAMFISYLLAALVAPFLETEQRTNFVAAILALYLLVSGAYTARRKVFIAGTSEKIGLAIALFITAIGISFMVMSSQSASGTVDGAPPEAFILFVVAGSIASAGELNAILRKTLSPTSRLVRHLWRMCFSFFIAAGSLFFGQTKFFPDWFNESLLQLLLGFFPFIILLVGVIKYGAPYRFVINKLKANR